MQQCNAMPEVKAKKAECYKQYMARPGMKEKNAEYDKKRYMARPEVKAKRARRSEQEQDQDAAEEAPTSNLRGKTYWDELSEATIKLAYYRRLLRFHRGHNQWSPSSSLTTASEAMPCPRHSHQAGRRAGPHSFLSKPFPFNCCVGTASGVRRLRRVQPRKAQPDSEGDAGWVAMLK